MNNKVIEESCYRQKKQAFESILRWEGARPEWQECREPREKEKNEDVHSIYNLEVHIKDLRFYSKSSDCHLKVIKQIVFHGTVAAGLRLVLRKSRPRSLERKEYGP